MRKKSDLPFGSEFSPSQIELAYVLELAELHGGNWHAFEAAVRTTYFEGHSTSDYNRGKLANNTKLGMIAYGIIDRDATLTNFGRELIALKDDEPALYRHLAKHILLNLHGMTLVRCIQDMVTTGEVVSLTTLRAGLAARGVHYPSGGKHPSMMRLWLVKAGVFVGSRWQVDPHRIEDILGLNPDEFEVLADFTPEQRAFLRALANTDMTDPQPANEIVKLATATYGVKFPEKSLPKLVLHRYPAELPEYFIRMLTEPGDFVVDPFAGSCVTGEVCERTKRRWTCIELLRGYCEAALGRFVRDPQEAKPVTDPQNPSHYYRVPRPNILWDGVHGEPLPNDGGEKRNLRPKGAQTTKPH